MSAPFMVTVTAVTLAAEDMVAPRGEHWDRPFLDLGTNLFQSVVGTMWWSLFQQALAT